MLSNTRTVVASKAKSVGRVEGSAKMSSVGSPPGVIGAGMTLSVISAGIAVSRPPFDVALGFMCIPLAPRPAEVRRLRIEPDVAPTSAYFQPGPTHCTKVKCAHLPAQC